MSSNPELGRRLAATRRQRNLSQAAVARRAGIAPSYLSRIEAGKVHPTLRTALRVASALKLSLDDLTGPLPPERTGRPCPVSPSGRCMLELIQLEGAPDPECDSAESFSPRDIRLLRRFTALLQQSGPNLLRALEVMVAEILEDRRSARR